jgi:hypothetical protein
MAEFANERFAPRGSAIANWPVPENQLLEAAELSTKALAQRGHLHGSGHIPRQGSEVRSGSTFVGVRGKLTSRTKRLTARPVPSGL